MTLRIEFPFPLLSGFVTTIFTSEFLNNLSKMVHKGKKVYLKRMNNSTGPEKVETSKASKKAKIIVRNLPFKNLSEKSVEDFFKEYGDIEEIKLLKKDDGKFVGCGFVQFKEVSSAAKAIRHANQKKMAGRAIVVDWALPKKTFLEKIQKLEENYSTDVKLENSTDDKDSKIEYVIDKKPNSCNINDEFDNSVEESDGEEKVLNGDFDDDDDDDNDGDDDGDDDDDDDDDDNDDDDDSNEDDGDKMKTKSNKKNDRNSNVGKSLMTNSDDVEDGKTVFVRNIPFSATNEDLKKCFESYGPLEYALICIDKLMEHSKGTGFVKFKDQESASKCVKDSTKIYLHENPLIVTMALSKTNLESKKNSKKVCKDSRNLYLIREGIVIAGSKAAAGVSAGDMAKRLQLEQWKNQILKNLNMFVSKTRLVIHNLPDFYDDIKLRNLFKKHSNPKAVIREAKVMYDKKKLDSTGKAVSKEVGFVSFTKHEDALQALRNINNNPDIFTPKKRPIVAFSIENRMALNSKVKRLEKSRAKLGIDDNKSDKLSVLNRKQRRFMRRREKFIQLRKEKLKSKQDQCLSNTEIENTDKNESSQKKRKKSEELLPNKKLKVNDSVETNESAVPDGFTGVISVPGRKIKLRSKFRLKNQVNIHSQNLKAERRKRREKERKNMTVRKPARQKKGKPKLMDDVNLSKLIKKHRESIQQSSVMKKWYDK